MKYKMLELLKELTEGKKKNFSKEEIIKMVKALKASPALKKKAIDRIKKSNVKIFTGVSTDGKAIQVDTKTKDRNLGTFSTSQRITL